MKVEFRNHESRVEEKMGVEAWEWGQKGGQELLPQERHGGLRGARKEDRAERLGKDEQWGCCGRKEGREAAEV